MNMLHRVSPSCVAIAFALGLVMLSQVTGCTSEAQRDGGVRIPAGTVQQDALEQIRAINANLADDPLTSEGLMLACDDLATGKNDTEAAATLLDTFEARGRADDAGLDQATAQRIVQIVKPNYCPAIAPRS